MTDRTGRRVARIAGQILAARFDAQAYVIISQWRNGRGREMSLPGKYLNAVCASCLTQHEPEYDGGRTPKRRKNGVVRKSRAKTRNPKGLGRKRKAKRALHLSG